MTDVIGCNALVRNSSLFKTEDECRAAVPLELDQVIALYDIWDVLAMKTCRKYAMKIWLRPEF